MSNGSEVVRFRVWLAIEMGNTFICMHLDIVLVFSCTLSYAIFVYETNFLQRHFIVFIIPICCSIVKTYYFCVICVC